MDETVGLRLIENLKNEPEKFNNEGKSYQLLEEYWKGFPRDTLRALFYSEDKWIRRTAIWMTFELGRDCGDLLKEVVAQINDDDEYILCFVLQIVASHAHDEYINDFIRVFSFLEHDNQRVRLFVMHIISGLLNSRIHEALVYLANRKEHSNSHEKGLLSLLDVNRLSSSKIKQMIDSDDGIIRKYGIIAANKLNEKYPKIIHKAVNNQDSDVREFSKWMIESKIEYERSMKKESGYRMAFRKITVSDSEWQWLYSFNDDDCQMYSFVLFKKAENSKIAAYFFERSDTYTNSSHGYCPFDKGLDATKNGEAVVINLNQPKFIAEILEYILESDDSTFLWTDKAGTRYYDGTKILHELGYYFVYSRVASFEGSSMLKFRTEC